MTFLEAIRSAAEALAGNKTRAALTVLGVVIGVLAVVLLLAIGVSTKNYVEDIITSVGFGNNAIGLYPGKTGAPWERGQLTYEDCRQLQDDIPQIVEIVPEIANSMLLKFGDRQHSTIVIGTSENFGDLVDWHTSEGAFFDRADMDNSNKVVVLGARVAEQLFRASSAIEERITIGDEKFIVVGTMARKGSMLMFDMDDMAFIPRTAAESLFGTRRLAEVLIMVDAPENVPYVQTRITEILSKRHKGREDFHMRTQAEMLGLVDKLMTGLTGFVVAIAAVSLVVGGVGIMNIMLVSVTERTREIGIRKSVGARNQDIFLQFLTESVAISLAGGLIGLAVGAAACFVAGRQIGLPLAVPAWAALAGLLFSLAVGVLSGVYPAMRAARLDPIEALRHD